MFKIQQPPSEEIMNKIFKNPPKPIFQPPYDGGFLPINGNGGT